MPKEKEKSEEPEKTEKSSESENSVPSSITFEASNSPEIRFPRFSFELQRELILKKQKELLIRYNTCFICLEQEFAELNFLQDENLKLNEENLDLSILVNAKENEIVSKIARGVVKDYWRVGFGGEKLGFGGEYEKKAVPEVLNVIGSQKGSGKSKTDEESKDRSAAALGVLPKSVSIRSKGYLAVNNTKSGCDVSYLKGGAASKNDRTKAHRLRVVAKSAEGDGETGVELEVYNQGMTKTELCSKWEETGQCPYGNHCQFAHGIQELRPVIRHPRYKTDICRMIMNGGTCPYGHRCHFRHSVDSTEDKEVVL